MRHADSGGEAVRALAVAIGSAIGIEADVRLTDVPGSSPLDAVAVMRWTRAPRSRPHARDVIAAPGPGASDPKVLPFEPA